MVVVGVVIGAMRLGVQPTSIETKEETATSAIRTMRTDHESEPTGMQPSSNSEGWSGYRLLGLRPDDSGICPAVLAASKPVGDPADGFESTCHFPDFDETSATISAPWWVSILKAGLAVVVIYMLVYLLTMSILTEFPEP